MSNQTYKLLFSTKIFLPLPIMLITLKETWGVLDFILRRLFTIKGVDTYQTWMINSDMSQYNLVFEITLSSFHLNWIISNIILFVYVYRSTSNIIDIILHFMNLLIKMPIGIFFAEKRLNFEEFTKSIRWRKVHEC